MPHPTIEAAQRFRQQLLSREQQAANRLVTAYGRAYGRMRENITALQQQIETSQVPTRAEVTRLGSLRSLLRQVEDEVNRFATYADTEIGNAATEAIRAGLNDSRSLAMSYFRTPQGQQAIAAGWDMLPVESVETMLGFLADDSPLHTALVNRLGPSVAERMANNLIDAITLGINPRQTAALVRRELGVGLTWALTTARTAQLYSYREASRAGYVANRDVVSGWRWFATLTDNRTCMSCINQHGSLHGVDEVLMEHHSGRCVAIPEIPLARRLGITLPAIERGEEWFKKQPQERQVALMGPSMFDAWTAGAFAFNDLSKPYQDAVYGEMLREASLKGLLGDKAQEYYRR